MTNRKRKKIEKKRKRTRLKIKKRIYVSDEEKDGKK